MNESHSSIIALGTFDGVHLGHQELIKHVLKIADHKNLKPIIVTFFPHPSHILSPEKPLKLINSIDERVKLIKGQGIESVYVHEFTKEFANQSASDFVENILINELNMKTLIVGHDHNFGRNKEGDFEFLTQLGKEKGFNVIQVKPFYYQGYLISSTLIRNLIIEGDFDKTNHFLGYPFCLFGKVVQGNQLGRKIGFNTANIVLDYFNKIVPRLGVYIVKTHIEGENYWGMMNIGYRPTVDGKTQTIEVHLFDLEKDLYYQNLKIKVLHWVREERKFSDINELKNQLENDKKEALNWIKINK